MLCELDCVINEYVYLTNLVNHCQKLNNVSCLMEDRDSANRLMTPQECILKYTGQSDCKDPALSEIRPETRIRFMTPGQMKA